MDAENEGNQMMFKLIIGIRKKTSLASIHALYFAVRLAKYIPPYSVLKGWNIRLLLICLVWKCHE